jgi:medium-chain acyl-[acyl-carrier-protein] hydrolase
MGISHYRMSFQVRSYEVGRLGMVSAGTLLRYLEHLATEGSAAAGYPRSWYDEHETAWVVRQMLYEQERPIGIGEQLALETWPSQFARIQAYREYLVSSADTGQMIARAHAHWVYVSRQRGLPIRLPADFADYAIPDPQEVRLAPAPTIQLFAEEAPHFRMVLRVRRSEADTMGHVNNTVYMDWLEEAAYEAVEAFPTSFVEQHDLPPARGRCFVKQARLDYMKPCLPGETVEVETICVGRYEAGLAWHQTITRPATEEVLLRAESLWAWLS